MRRAIVSGMFFMLAPVTAFHAQVAAGNPAPEWARSWNGFGLAKQALGHVEAEREGEDRLNINVDTEAVGLAKTAYAKEPFASNSHFILSLETESPEKLLWGSRELDKRNRLTALTLLQSAARQRDVEAMMPLVDEVSRLEPQIASQFVSLISDSLEDPPSYKAIRAALIEHPSWEPAFWRTIPSEAPLLDRYLALRNDLAPARDQVAEQRLINRLIETQRYEEAFSYYRSFKTPKVDRPPSGSPRLPPIDWQLHKARSSNSRDAADGGLQFYVAANSAGELARKLVRLEPGKYQLESEITPSQGSGELTADLLCASGPSNPDWRSQALADLPSWQVEGSGCSYAWLVIKGAAWDSSVPYEGRLDRPRIYKPRIAAE